MDAVPKAFITYSHNDKDERMELRTRLAVMVNKGEIELWDDNEILPGDEWYNDIADNLANSHILLYLVSAESLASKNCNKELADALNTDTRVIPVILEACDWKNHKLSRFEVLPDKGKSINEWVPESTGWQNVVEGVRKTIYKMQGLEDASSKISEKELSAEIAFQHGNVLMILGQIDKAIKAYSHAIKLDSHHADAYG
ncbi:MAG: TIR domain-containing protein, partial [Candidatus Poribacteria bacterium]|nr:TIR domain-containing protein [Candidatus Poribacteria bacterium]